MSEKPREPAVQKISKEALFKENTLRKIGAHLRWQMEKCGIRAADIEKQIVVIVVDSEETKAKIIEGFKIGFDRDSMIRDTSKPDRLIVHGVRISVTVKQEGKEAA